MTMYNGNIPMNYQASYIPWYMNDGVHTLGDTANSFNDLFASQNVERRQYEMGEQSANNQMLRDLYVQEIANEFNAREAEKQRAFEEQMSNSAYTRAVADMKNAGINPILAIGNGGAAVPQGASASASGARSGGSNYSGTHSNSGLVGLLAILSGLLARGKTNGSTLTQTFDKHGELVRSVVNSKMKK